MFVIIHYVFLLINVQFGQIQYLVLLSAPYILPLKGEVLRRVWIKRAYIILENDSSVFVLQKDERSLYVV